MSTEESKAGEHRFYEEMLHRHNLDAIDELVTPISRSLGCYESH